MSIRNGKLEYNQSIKKIFSISTKLRRGFGLFFMVFLPTLINGQNIWEVVTYPDESGFQQRTAPHLQKIAAQSFGKRSLASSKCPDTGLPVKTWAVEGETIISPYTGRAYKQGPTGYFGPKRRNEAGQIIAFGGDPLKYDLPPATATLLLNPKNEAAKAFLSIPGNLRQQYHFACKNWARFYPLLANKMGEEWKASFHDAVGEYSERRRPSDGVKRELLSLSQAHTLVGNKGFLLGGNTIDGGTENHKTMWRTSALVYAQLFPENSLISSYSTQEALALSKEMIRDFLQRIIQMGNGEYDSQIYYPHSIEGFLNLYDFSTDPELKELAKFALDYYFMSYGLKVVDGAVAGGQKRGYLPDEKPGEMESFLWAYFDASSRSVDGYHPKLHQVTTTYRPNKVIYNLIKQKMEKPYSMRISRPFYHMDHYNAFQESFYRSKSYGMGNVYMSIVDNPNQQMVWSLIAEGKEGPLGFSGGQAYAQTSFGHSPYTQTLHHENTLLLLSAPTQAKEDNKDFKINKKRMNPWHLPDSAQVQSYEETNRIRYGSKPLQAISSTPPQSVEELNEFWAQKNTSAASWLWVPKQTDKRTMTEDRLLIQANKTFVSIRFIGDEPFWVAPDSKTLAQVTARGFKKALQHYDLFVIPGEVSGYILEAAETSDYSDLNSFGQDLEKNSKLTLRGLKLQYKNLKGDKLKMEYQPDKLKAKSSINNKALDYDNWNDGAVYTGPYLNIKEGVLEVSDGKEGYQVDFRGNQPIYKALK
ncbi:MAG: hypothetical protein AAFO07_14565 [Bacteroidota bacterium]